MADVRLAPSQIGRKRHVDRALRWVNELAMGRGRAVLVEGEPGIGKSSLMQVMAADAESMGCQVFWAACDELSQAFPLLPLLDVLDDPQRGEKNIAGLLRADTLGNRVDLVAAVTERLLAIVDDLCTRAPVLLLVDDLQWADPATVQMLGRLARSAPQLPLLVVVTSRPVPRRDDLGALRRAIDASCVIRLHSMTDEEIVELVSARIGGTPGPRLLRLAAGAAGNPLYLTELVEALIRGRALTTVDGCVEFGGGRPPTSLAAAIAHRLEFLSAPVRGVLRAAALLGADFSVADLALVSGESVNSLVPLLDEAILAEVVHEHGAKLAFRHPLIRAALYEDMPVAVRAAWHGDAAKALADGGAAPDRVARQLLPALEAHDAAKPADRWMVNWLERSAQQLVGQAPGAAIRLLRWAMRGTGVGDAPYDVLACRLADALYRTGDAEGAAQVAFGALAHVSNPDLIVDLHWTLAQFRTMDGRSEESLAALAAALRSPALGPRHRSRLLVLTARTHCSLGRVDVAHEVANEALSIAKTAGDAWATGWALAILTIVHGMRGEPTEAIPLFERALAVAQGDPALADLRLFLLVDHAVTLGELDRYEAAIGAAEEARRLADDAGNVVRSAQARSVLCELLFDVGRWDDALAEVDDGSSSVKNPLVECCDHGIAATIRLHRRDATAHVHLAAAEQAAERLGDRVVVSLALARSLDREQADRPEEALAVLVSGLRDTEEADVAVDLLADAARLAVAVGNKRAARDFVARADLVASTSDVPHVRAVAPHCRGLLERDPDQLLDAAERYGTAGLPLPRAQALEAAGVVLAERGDVSAARSHFTKAFALYSELGAEWDLARTQATFRAYGIRRGPHARHRRADHGWSSLTPTEVKVARLVADGMSNPQIAAHLFLSRRTVQTHVSHILAKLNLHSRTEIAREASRRD